ncbi:hypothetical protein OLX02_01590 [Novosphingobium sp. KCTC 2891]|uniref:hypothetical protein n=1 Tax=Novosphingobium sp. KCTC 2891 TaxID=2989730 RepID=UPI0022231E45|nr:hypothetical protein [Novosphingobium sp. KCTC 2891]MCW1381507.1 hypothetical protein [Novosphingobium sp. KCTC 2891]
MAKRSVVANHLIVASDPDPKMEFTGQYDDKGEPVLQKQTYSIEPGTVFEMDEADPDFLPFLEQETIRLATDLESERGRAIEA